MAHDARKHKGLQPLRSGGMMYSKCVYGLLALVLAACSPSSDPTPKIAESQRQALDKAKAVEGQMQQAADAARQDIDRQSE